MHGSDHPRERRVTPRRADRPRLGHLACPDEDPHTTPGQGIRLMRACVEHLTIDSSDDGTTVTLHSRPVPR